MYYALQDKLLQRILVKPTKNKLQTMKKISYFLFLICVLSCTSGKKVLATEPLFKILKSSQDQGGSFRFYETVTEKNEFSMVLNDPDLKKIVFPNDIVTCNFAIINLGTKSSKGYAIAVSLEAETSEKITLKITESAPKIDNNEQSNPLFILKINSKKILELH